MPIGRVQQSESQETLPRKARSRQNEGGRLRAAMDRITKPCQDDGRRRLIIHHLLLFILSSLHGRILSSSLTKYPLRPLA